MQGIKILHIYKSFADGNIGGVEKFIETIITSDKINYHEVFTVGLRTSVIFFKNIKVHIFKKNFEIASTPFSLGFFLNFKQVSDSFDLLHFHYPYPFADLVYIILGCKKPYVITYHSDIVSQKKLKILYKPIETFFLGNALKIYATSPNYINSSKNLKSLKFKVTPIPIGIIPQKVKLTSKFNVPDKYFIYIGVLRYYKGIDILIECSKLNRLPIVIIGDGPYKNYLLNQISLYNLENIIYFQNVNDAEKYYLISKSYAFLFPSKFRSEAFGIALIEAFSQKKPVITFELRTGTSFININNYTGFIIHKIDPKLYSDAMVYLWNNRRVTTKFGYNAYKRYKNFFTAKIFINSYLNEYKAIFPKKNCILSVSIVVFNSNLDVLNKLINELLLYKNVKIYLIDNFNKPLKKLFLDAFMNKIIYIKNTLNVGYGRAHNESIKYIRNFSKYHLIINPDVCLSIDVIRSLINFLDVNPQSSCAMPKVLNMNKSSQDLVRLLPSFYILIIKRFFYRYKFNFFRSQISRYLLKNQEINCPINVPSLSGCFILVRTKLFCSIGGFDPRFFMYMEDIDLTRRLKFDGRYDTTYIPNEFILHLYAKKSYKSLKHLVYHITSAIKYFNKWGWFFDQERKKINSEFLKKN